jgi:hypothetical protein
MKSKSTIQAAGTPPVALQRACSAAGVERAMELRKEIFDIANSYAGDETGDIAVMLHQSCNCILNARQMLEEYQRQNTKLCDGK